MTRHARKLTAGAAVMSVMLAGATAGPFAAASGAAIQGVWRTVEVVVPGPVGGTFTPAAALAIFHGRHYSRVEVHAEGPRPLLDIPAAASADQLRATWGPFFGEAGTFEVTGGDTITMRAMVAKNPSAMRDGAATVYRYRLEGDRLTLTQISTPVDPHAQPVTATLTRVE